jgi:hypothetical protein
MKKKLLITGIKIGQDHYCHEYLDSFEVKGHTGKFYVDALVSGCFDDEVDNMSADDQIEWARKQVGKHLFCDDLSSIGYIALGKTYII